MSFAAGQLLAYLKVAVLALAVIAVVGGIVKFVESKGRDETGGGNGPEGG